MPNAGTQSLQRYRLLYLGAPLKSLGPIGIGCSASEVVDGNRVEPSLGEARCQFPIIGVQAAHVGQDRNPDPVAGNGMRRVRQQVVPIRSGEGEISLVRNVPDHRRGRGTTLIAVTHGCDLSARSVEALPSPAAPDLST
jgi:hypothetical protein